MKLSTKAKSILIIFLFIIAAGALVWWRMSPENTKVNKEMAAVAVQKGTVEAAVSVNGTVQPSIVRNLTAKASGKLVSIDFKDGQRVKKGDLLLKLDTASLVAEIERSRLDVKQAELERNSTLGQIKQQEVFSPAGGRVVLLEVTDGQFVQKNSLLMIISDGTKSTAVKAAAAGTLKLSVTAQGSVKTGDRVAFVEIDNINTQLESQEIHLQQAKLNLEILQAKLSDYDIRAPFDGVVTLAQAGEAAAQQQGSWIEGDYVQIGHVLATIHGSGTMVVDVPVDEVDIAKVKLGQTAVVTVDALSDRELSGTVISIETSGKVNSGVASFDVQVAVDGPEGLKQGMTANVEILVDRKENVLVVPIEAVQEKQGKKYVQMDDSTGGLDNGEDLQPVETGIYNESVIEILSGLNEGDSVLLPNVVRNEEKNGMGGGVRRPF